MSVEIEKNSKFYTCLSKISNLIANTKWEGKVFVCGDCVRKIMIGETPTKVELCVEEENGAVNFSEWLAKATNNYEPFSNPIHFMISDTYNLVIKNDGRISDVDIRIRGTRKPKLVNGNIVYEFCPLEVDAKHLEMTANALYISLPSGNIYDILKSANKDIEEKLVRGCSDKLDELFKTNPIYMMRIIRCASTLGWGIEKNTWLAILQNAKYIVNSKDYEVKTELSWICLADKPSVGIKRLLTSGLLRYILPEVSNLVMEKTVISSGDNLFEHTLEVMDKTSKLLTIRLAALLHEVGKPSTHSVVLGVHKYLSFENVGAKIGFDALDRLKFSQTICESVGKIIRLQTCLSRVASSVSPSNKAIRKIMAVCGNDIETIFDLIEADNRSMKKGLSVYNLTKTILSRIKFLENDGKPIKDDFPINGKDIMEMLHVKSSPRIGEYLKIAKEAFKNTPTMSKDELLKYVSEYAMS